MCVLCRNTEFQNFCLTPSGPTHFRVSYSLRENLDKDITRIKKFLEFNFREVLFIQKPKDLQMLPHLGSPKAPGWDWIKELLT